MSELSALPVWGVVPPPVAAVLQRLKTKAADAVSAMDAAQITSSTPQNHDEAFLKMSAAAEAADRATRDYRSVFNAYAHRFHKPKPPIGELAAMQGTITQSFASRYTAKTVGAIEALLSPAPDLDAIRLGIRALGFNDLRGISPELDRQIALAEADTKFVPWKPVPDAFGRNSVAEGAADQSLGDLSFDLSRKVSSPEAVAEL